MSEGSPPLIEVLLRQREAWQRGDKLLVEYFLDRHPHLSQQEDAVLDLIYNEILLREETGEKIPFEEYLRRFPHLDRALRVQFEVEQALTVEEVLSSSLELPSTLPVLNSSLVARLPELEGCDLLGELGRGAMGVVYRGWQHGAQRPVAVKLLNHDIPLGRVRIEAEAAARLQHPNIVQIFEVKEHEGRTALVLEYVEGGNLAQKLAGKPQAPRETARMVETLAWAMAYAHGRGVIHRDLKPSNILLSAGPDEPLGRCIPKIGDFGLAKLVEGGQKLTATSDILGTPSYMAPEQIGSSSSTIGPTTDVYSLGAILYECLTGRPPFLGQTVLDTLDQVRNQDAVPPSRLQPKIPRDLEIICLKCLHKQPPRRYLSSRELAEDLRRFQAGEPIRARPVGPVERIAKWAQRHPTAAALALVSILAVSLLLVGWVLYSEEVRQQRDLAQRQAHELDEQLQRTRRLLYTAQLLRVGSVWESDPAQGLRMLEDQMACPPDLRCFSWGVLHAQCKRYRQLLQGHSGAITALAHYPRGQLFAAGDANGLIRLWDSSTGQETSWLEGHPRPVTALAFTRDGVELASGAADGSIHLWEMPAGRLRGRLNVTGRIAGLAWHPDGKTLYVVAGNTKALVTSWDARALRLRRTLRGEFHPLSRIALSQEGHTLACGGLDHALKLWDTRTGKLLKQLAGHTAPVTSVLFVGSEATLLSGGLDGTVRVWDLARGKERDRFVVSTGPVTSLALHPEEQIVAVSGRGAVEVSDEIVPDVQLWDLVSRKEKEPLHAHHGGTQALTFAPDGKTLLTGGADRAIKLWDHPARLERLTLQRIVALPQSVTLSEDGRKLAYRARRSGEEETPQEIHVLDLESGRLLHLFRGQGRPIQAMALSRQGKHLAAAVGLPDEPAELLVWEVGSGRLLQAFSGHPGPVVGMAFLPNGQLLLSASREGQVRINELATGKVSAQWTSSHRPMLALHAKGSRIVLLAGKGENKMVQCWSYPEGALVGEWPVPEQTECLALASTGNLLALGGASSEVQLRNAETGETQECFSVGMKQIAHLAFSAEGQTLAIAGSSAAVKIWDVPTAQERASLPGHRGGASFAAFADDGHVLVTVSLTQGARLWHHPRPARKR